MKLLKHILWFFFVIGIFCSSDLCGMKYENYFAGIDNVDKDGYLYDLSTVDSDFLKILAYHMKETYMRAFEYLYSFKEALQNWRNELLENFFNYRYLLAAWDRRRKKIVGFNFFRVFKKDIFLSEKEDRARVSLLAVHPEFQGRGIGGRLVFFPFEAHQFRAVEEIRLFSDYFKSKKFYENRGFKSLLDDEDQYAIHKKTYLEKKRCI